MRRALILLLLACLSAGTSTSWQKQEEVDEDRWWYAPSRKAHLHAHKYEQKLQQLNFATARQGEDFRLPRDVIPTLYNLRLLPFIEVGNFTTSG